MGKDLLAEILTDLKHEEGLRAVRAQKRMMTAFMNRKGN